MPPRVWYAASLRLSLTLSVAIGFEGHYASGIDFRPDDLDLLW